METNTTKPGGNIMLHIAINPDGSLQPIVNARIPFGDISILQILLNTDRPGASFKNTETGGYLFVYDNNLKPPYPSVMIWKYYIREDGQRIICDMERSDMDIIPYAISTYLDSNKQ